jgi:8-oxo-dGTP pyrophosphatase MutT (NUDIX family)
MNELRSCGVLIVRGDPIREFLLMRHPTRWDLPKGHVDPGETDLQCALRELWEETGIPEDAVTIDPEFRFSLRYNVRSKRTGGDTWPKTLMIYLGTLVRDVPITTSEHESFQWFAWRPGQRIQAQTIDPLLAAVEEHVQA